MKQEDVSLEAYAYYDGVLLALTSCVPDDPEIKLEVWSYLVQMLCTWITEEKRGLDGL